MISEDYKAGWSRGFEEGSPGKKIDAFWLSSFVNEYRVGYVLGFGESAFPGVPTEYRYRFIGELAEQAHVPLSHFEQFGGLDRVYLEQFRAGYLGDEVNEDLDDDSDGD